ncbi:CGP-CTERM sorting domain-containing protein [Thermococcus celericrescens]|nr:CGP-CTERM sorting domain-containing protein [Thermococcus celericrescens]
MKWKSTARTTWGSVMFKRVFLVFLIFSSLTGFASAGIVYQAGLGDGFSAYTEVYSDGENAFLLVTYTPTQWPAHLGPVCEGFWNYTLEEKPFHCYLSPVVWYYFPFYFDGDNLYFVNPFLDDFSSKSSEISSHPLFYRQDSAWTMVFFGQKEPFPSLVWRFDRNCIDYLGVGNYTREQRSPTTKPVEGVLENGTVLFSNGSQTYVIPIEELEPYFDANFMVKHLEGVFLKEGILLYPAVYQGIWNITPGQHDYSRVVLFGKEESETKLLNTSSLKPFPVFFYDGKSLKVFRIFRIVENGKLEVFVEKNFFTHWPKCIYRNVTITMTKTVAITMTKTVTETKEHTKTVTETKREEGICGPAFIVLLSLMILALRGSK